MAETYLPGLASGLITIAGIAHEITEGNIKVENEDIPLKTMVAPGQIPWVQQITGGWCQLTGSISGIWKVGGVAIAPRELCALSFLIGTVNITANVFVSDLEVKKAEGAVTFTANFKSSGEVKAS